MYQNSFEYGIFEFFLNSNLVAFYISFRYKVGYEKKNYFTERAGNLMVSQCKFRKSYIVMLCH